jgi:PhnB protein
MSDPIPYLAFDGNCAEAMRYYEKALGAKLEVLMDGASSPMADQVSKEHAHRIIFSRLVLPDGGLVYAGDTPAHLPYEGIKGISLVLNYDTVDRARAVFDQLAAGGQVNMPMQPSFWAKAWGMLVDKYGVAWMVNGEVQPF